MKKGLLIIASVAIILLSNSCNKCATCTIYPGTTTKICEKSYSSKDDYNSAFHQLEAQGYNCHD